MTLRNKEGYQEDIYHFLNDIYIICPKCSKQAFVKSSKEHYSVKEAVSLICTYCGHNKAINNYSRTIYFSTRSIPAFKKYVLIGSPLDPFFHLPLWLTINCCNNLLWAYNYEHLNFLKLHIEAKLRERNGIEVRNQSLGSRLPRWMTSSKNREEVIKAIENLQNK